MQCWQMTDGGKIQLVVVTPEAVYADQFDEAAGRQQRARLDAGEAPMRVFGDSATHVVLRSLQKVTHDSSDDELTFESGEGKESRTSSIAFPDPAVRDAVFAAIAQATAGRFKRYEDPQSRARAAFGPALALSLLAMGTAVAVKAAIAIREAGEVVVEGRKKGVKELVVNVLDLLGPTGVTIIGALLCALALFVLVQRIKSPPHLMMLQARTFHAPSPLFTGLKYALLAGLWVLLGPGLLSP